MTGRAVADWDRPAVWVLDRDDVTRHAGREHMRWTNRDGRVRVVVLFEVGGTGLRDYRVVAGERVTPREDEDD